MHYMFAYGKKFISTLCYGLKIPTDNYAHLMVSIHSYRRKKQHKYTMNLWFLSMNFSHITGNELARTHRQKLNIKKKKKSDLAEQLSALWV